MPDEPLSHSTAMHPHQSSAEMAKQGSHSSSALKRLRAVAFFDDYSVAQRVFELALRRAVVECAGFPLESDSEGLEGEERATAVEPKTHRSRKAEQLCEPSV
jgi:hypothetical protein